MKYVVRVNGSDIEVSVEGERVRVQDETSSARLIDVEGTPTQLLMLGDSVHRVQVRRGAKRGEYVLSLDGFHFSVEAFDERSRAIREASAAAGGTVGPAPLVAPMPGMIVRVSVQEGEAVKLGQGLVVMEAMKMENELRAARAGRVKRVVVSPGMAVEKGALLLEMD